MSGGLGVEPPRFAAVCGRLFATASVHVVLRNSVPMGRVQKKRCLRGVTGDWFHLAGAAFCSRCVFRDLMFSWQGHWVRHIVRGGCVVVYFLWYGQHSFAACAWI